MATGESALRLRGEAIFELGPLAPEDAAEFFERCAGGPNGSTATLLAGAPFALEFAAAAIAGEPSSLHGRLLGSDDAVGRAIAIAELLARSDVPSEIRLRAMLAACHAAAVTGDLAAFDRLLDWLAANAAVGPDEPFGHAVASLECIRLAHHRVGGDEALARSAEICTRELTRARRAGHDLLLELTLAQAVIARRSDRRDVARSGFDRVLREIRAGISPYLMPLAALEAAIFLLGAQKTDEALSLLLDVSRYVRRVPLAAPAASALEAYVYAGCLRDNLEIAARLHAFVTEFRAARARPRSPVAHELYASVLDRYGLPAEPPEPDIAGLAQAFELALSI